LKNNKIQRSALFDGYLTAAPDGLLGSRWRVGSAPEQVERRIMELLREVTE